MSAREAPTSADGVPAGLPSRHYRFAYLLVAQLAVIVLYPFLAGDQQRPGLLTALILCIFIAALWAVAGERRITIVAALLAAPAITGSLMTVAIPGYLPPAFGIVSGILFLLFVTAVILRGVVTSAEVTTETLYGAVATYLMLGMVWGWAYALVERLQPESFRSLLSADGRIAGPEFMFLSFITLTSVGYGDIVPVGSYARSLAILEAVAGQMYLAVFIARLVGLHAQRPARS